MSDVAKRYEKEENERRAAMGLPPARARKSSYTVEEIDQYLSEVRSAGKRLYSDPTDIDSYVERVKKRVLEELSFSKKSEQKKSKPKKKSKIDSSDSILVVDETTGEINRVPVSSEADNKESKKVEETIRERMAVPSAERTFKDRFSGVSKLVKLFESKQSNDRKDKTRQSEELRKQVEQNQNVGVALEALSREQEITVKLLRELLDSVKNINKPRNSAMDAVASMLGGRERGGPSLRNMLIGGMVVGAGAGIFASTVGDFNREQFGESIENAGGERRETRVGPTAENESFNPEDILNESSEDQIFQRIINTLPESLRSDPELVDAARNQARSEYEQRQRAEEEPRRNQSATAIIPTAPVATPAPVAPAAPATPAVPVAPAAPATPAVPIAPAVPVAPPEIAAVPAAPAMPGVPGATNSTPIIPFEYEVTPEPQNATPITNSLITPTSYSETNDNQDAVAIEEDEIVPLPKKNDEAIVSEAIREREVLSKALEDRPDMFSNRSLVIRARNVKFKGDEIEFKQSDSLIDKADAQKLPGSTPFGSSGLGSSPGGGSAVPPPPAGKEDIGSSSLMKPTGGKITSGFGQRAMGDHKGIDFGIPIGSPIVSAQSGTVVEARTSASYGNMIKIRGNDGLETLYAHLSTIGVQVGQQVEKGQQIALSGNTGRSTGPHLHFEAIKDGNKVDPAPLMNASGEIPANKQSATPESTQDAPSTSQSSAAATPVSSESVSGESSAAPAATPVSSESAGGEGESVPSATPEPSAPTAGVEVAQASVENEIAARTPEEPTISQVPAAGDQGQPSINNPTYMHSVNDPGPVEPADAAERYAKLFNMAA